MSSGGTWGINTATDIGLFTEHLNKLKSYCPPLLKCCDDQPKTIKGMFWLSEPDSGGGGDTFLICETVTLTLLEERDPSGAL